MLLIFFEIIILDKLVKSSLLRNSHVGWNPEDVEMTRFPPTREWRDGEEIEFLRRHHINKIPVNK